MRPCTQDIARPRRPPPKTFFHSFLSLELENDDVSFGRPNLGFGDVYAKSPPVSSLSELMQPLWPHWLSASFSVMVDQIAALALLPTNAFSGSEELAALRGRLDRIEQTQARMAAEMKVIARGTVQAAAAVNSGGGDANGIEVTVVDEGEPEKDPVTVKLKETE
jgi:hypothetical protein